MYWDQFFSWNSVTTIRGTKWSQDCFGKSPLGFRFVLHFVYFSVGWADLGWSLSLCFLTTFLFQILCSAQLHRNRWPWVSGWANIASVIVKESWWRPSHLSKGAGEGHVRVGFISALSCYVLVPVEPVLLPSPRVVPHCYSFAFLAHCLLVISVNDLLVISPPLWPPCVLAFLHSLWNAVWPWHILTCHKLCTLNSSWEPTSIGVGYFCPRHTLPCRVCLLDTSSQCPDETLLQRSELDTFLWLPIPYTIIRSLLIIKDPLFCDM